jgi:predicted kinase
MIQQNKNVLDLCLILLRGLPGSGKSTLAGILSEDGKYPCMSVDDFFTDHATGKYHFEYDKNHIAYKQCEEQTRKQMEHKSPKIFVHNTFIFDWEIMPYIKLAAAHKYKLFVVTVEKYHQDDNIHKVTQEQIQKMAQKYNVRLC